ncbi:hypothetical protein HQ529_00845 [Candidatus Woesearchaeota archaeon]|nr:hypothetical protein [Candidatus Woesearchaeota archaeon]
MAGAWNQVSMRHLVREEKIAECPDCQSTEIELKDGDRFCKKCGLVID